MMVYVATTVGFALAWVVALAVFWVTASRLAEARTLARQGIRERNIARREAERYRNGWVKRSGLEAPAHCFEWEHITRDDDTVEMEAD